MITQEQISILKDLGALRDQGILSDEEFQQKKTEILNGATAHPSPAVPDVDASDTHEGTPTTGRVAPFSLDDLRESLRYPGVWITEVKDPEWIRALDADELDALIEKSVSSIRKLASLNPNLTDSSLKKLLRDRDDIVRLHLAAHPDLPQWAYQALSVEESSKIIGLLASNASISEQVAVDILERTIKRVNAQDDSIDVRIFHSLASRTPLPDTLAQALIQVVIDFSRERAREPTTYDASWRTRMAVRQINEGLIHNPTTRSDILKTVMQSQYNRDGSFWGYHSYHATISAHRNAPANIASLQPPMQVPWLILFVLALPLLPFVILYVMIQNQKRRAHLKPLYD